MNFGYARTFLFGCVVVGALGVGCKTAKKDEPPTVNELPGPSKEEVARANAERADAERKAKEQREFDSIPDEKLWLGAPEANVKGASVLRCEVKTLGGWMRVNCHGKDATGGAPSSSTVVGKSDAVSKIARFERKGESVALLFPYVAGTHLEAIFSWTDGNRKLTVDWPSTTTVPPGLKGTFVPYTGEITPVTVDLEATLTQAPVVPIRASVEDLIANGKGYEGKVLSVMGWQNGSVDIYMGVGAALYPDEENSNAINFKTSDLTPDERKMLIRGAFHVVVIGLWQGGMIETYSVRKTSGSENEARVMQMIGEEADRLGQKGF